MRKSMPSVKNTVGVPQLLQLASLRASGYQVLFGMEIDNKKSKT